MKRLILLLPLLTDAPAIAEVKSATGAGFYVESRTVVPATAAETYEALARIGQWWNSEHTYSGNASNMALEPKAGGCFCEAIPGDGGTIEHGRVIYARPGQALRVDGALGPLQSEAVTGTLTWQLKAAGGGTEVTQSYVVGGYVRGGAEKLAPLVDAVLADQLAGLARHLDESAESED